MAVFTPSGRRIIRTENRFVKALAELNDMTYDAVNKLYRKHNGDLQLVKLAIKFNHE